MTLFGWDTFVIILSAKENFITFVAVYLNTVKELMIMMVMVVAVAFVALR